MADVARVSGAGALSAGARTPWFLTTPPEPKGTIDRPRVSGRLREAVREHPVVALGAPSGYGKTTVAAAWARESEHPVAWLSLTRFDGDPDRVISGVLAAIRRPVVDPAALAVLDAAGPRLADPADFVDAIASMLHALPEGLTLVVDQAEYIHDLASSPLAALATKRPRGLHLLVLATLPSADLAHGLSAHRACETLGVDELAFDLDEITRALAADRASTADPETVRERTAGWPIAVRAASAGATSGDRDLDDYVEEEILAGLPPQLADIIRSTSILTVLDAETASAISGHEDAGMHLEECVRRGLFIDRVSRDGRRLYMWHSAFRDAVQASEERRHPTVVAERHLHAAELMAEDSPLLTVEHYLAGHAPERAFQLILERWLEMLQEGRAGALDRACASLPDAHADRSAILGIRACCAWTLGDAAGARLLRRRGESSPPSTPAERAASAIAGLLTTDDPARLRAYVLESEEALAHPDAVNHRATAYTLFALGYAAMRLRRSPVDPIPTLRTALREADAQGRPRLAARVAGTLAFALAFVGEFEDAVAHAERSGSLPHDDEWQIYDGGAASCALGFVAYWRGDLTGAKAAFTDVRRLSIGPTAYEPVAHMYDALCAAASDDLGWQSEALERLRAMPADTILGVPWQGFRDCALAALAVARDRQGDAVRYAVRVLQIDDYLPVPVALAAETLRRCGEPDRARAVIAETQIPALTVPARVSIMVTDALLRDDTGRDDAHVVLERALDLASSERILQPFLIGQPELSDLLERHAQWGSSHDALIAEVLSRTATNTTQDFSQREQEILAYLRTPMTLAEIADALFLSTNTVKTHVQSLYRKLGVQSRREAVRVRL